MKKMKKEMAVFMVAVMMTAVFTACSGKKETAAVSPEGQQETEIKGAADDKKEETDDSTDKIVIRYSHVQSTSSPPHQAAEFLKQYLEEKSGGRVTMEIFPAGQLYNDATEIAALGGGNIDMISTYMSKLTSVDTAMQYCLAPYLFDSPEQMLEFYSDEKTKELLYGSLDQAGIEVIDCFFGGSQYFMSNGKAINSAADFKGMKVREGGGKMCEALYSALGASVTTVAYNDLYTAMQTKLVDVAVISVDGATGIKLQETLKNVSSFKHQFAPYLIMFNQETFSSYPEDIQQLIREGIAEARKFQLEKVYEISEKGLAEIQQVCNYHEATEEEIEELKSIWNPVVQEYVSPEWMNAIDSFKAAYVE